MSLNWVLAEEPLDLETELALDFLDYLLVRRVFLVAVPLWPVLDTCGHIRVALEAFVLGTAALQMADCSPSTFLTTCWCSCSPHSLRLQRSLLLCVSSPLLL